MTGRTGEGPNGRPEDRLEQLIGSLQAGAPDAPGDAEEAELVEVAGALLRASGAIPAPQRRAQTLSRLMSDVEAAKATPRQKGVQAMVTGWFRRPAARTALASMAAIVIVGGAGLGAAAAGSEPVRDLLRISSTSTIKVEFEGTVIQINGNALTVDAGGQVRTVTVDGGTSIRRSGANVAFDAIAVGNTVEIHGKLLEDNTVLATRIQVEDRAPVPPTAGAGTAQPTTVPATAQPTTAPATAQPTTGLTPQPTVDDDDCDNSGPGSSNSGPGHDEDCDDDRHDDDRDEDNSGPGSGDDDNSGPGNGDEDRDDNSGSGSHSGRDSGGDDDGGDDNSSSGNSGHGGGGDDE